MPKFLSCVGALALTAALSACGGNEAAENNFVAEDVNAMDKLEELAPPEPANEAAETPAEEPEPGATKPAPAKPAPAKPKPPAPKPAEPEAPASDCPPEHREAGHC